MNLKERIQDDMKVAMRAKDAARLSTIRMLLAAIKQREVDERIVLADADVVGIVDKLIKQRRDSITAFRQGGRADLVEKESAEVAVLEGYLPARLSADEIGQAVQALVAEGKLRSGNTIVVVSAISAGEQIIDGVEMRTVA